MIRQCEARGCPLDSTKTVIHAAGQRRASLCDFHAILALGVIRGAAETSGTDAENHKEESDV